MGGGSTPTSFAASLVLIVINLVVMLVAVCLSALGAWVIASPASLLKALEKINSRALNLLVTEQVLTFQLGVAFVIVACFALLVAYFGLHAAITKSKFTIFMYSTLVMLLMLLEMTFFYYSTSQLSEKWRGGDSDGPVWSAAAHSIRLTFGCCGRYNYTDILSDSRDLPWSCCGFANTCTPERAYTVGCSTAISTWTSGHQMPVYTSLVVAHSALALCALAVRVRRFPPRP